MRRQCQMNTLTALEVSKYGVISGPYFRVFGLNTGKYRPEITPYLGTFHAVLWSHNNSMGNKKENSDLIWLKHLFECQVAFVSLLLPYVLTYCSLIATVTRSVFTTFLTSNMERFAKIING